MERLEMFEDHEHEEFWQAIARLNARRDRERAERAEHTNGTNPQLETPRVDN